MSKIGPIEVFLSVIYIVHCHILNQFLAQICMMYGIIKN